MSRQFDGIVRQLRTTNGRLEQLETRFDARLERLDNLRDRTGTLKGILYTFMNAGPSRNEA